jgi:hypothetical protein
MQHQILIVGSGKPNDNEGFDGNYFLDKDSTPNILYHRDTEGWKKIKITLEEIPELIIPETTTTTTTTVTEKIINTNEEILDKINNIKIDIIKEKLNFEEFILTAPAKLEKAFDDLKNKIINDIIIEKQNTLNDIKLQKDEISQTSCPPEIETAGTTLNGFFRNVGRLKFEIFSLLIIFSSLYFIPNTDIPTDGSNPQTAEIVKFGLIWLFATKFLLVSAGIVHAHISRKILFSYIKFRCEKEWSNNAIIIALYVVIIWAWATGG